MHEAEELSTSSESEHRQETKGDQSFYKIPGMNIPEFAESFISVEVLAGPSNQVLAKRVKQSSLGKDGQAIKSW